MTVATATTLVDSLMDVLGNSHETVNQINAACAEKKLPPAFEDSNSSLIINIKGNPDYRFEGFGVIVVRPFPPKLALSFWVHYKPCTPQHIALGRFTVPISILDAIKFRSASSS